RWWLALGTGRRPPARAPPGARVHARRGPRIGRQSFGARKPRDIAHLEGNHHRERVPHAWQGQEPLNRRCQLEGGLNPLFERVHLPAQLLDLPEQLLAGVRRVRREKLEALPQERTAPYAAEIAHVQVVESVLCPTGVRP